MQALEVAKYVVNLCLEQGRPISNLQLQKILYFANIFYIMRKNTPLIKDDFQAWKFGPVIPEVYREYSIYANAPIIPFYKENPDIDHKKMQIVKKLIINLSATEPWRLVELSHLKNGAWDRTYKDGAGNREIIASQLIYDEAEYHKGVSQK